MVVVTRKIMNQENVKLKGSQNLRGLSIMIPLKFDKAILVWTQTKAAWMVVCIMVLPASALSREVRKRNDTHSNIILEQ